MRTAGATFSESWHLVANLRLKLRSSVDVQRQFYRGEKWFVIRDPYNNRFFRVLPPAYNFIMRLDGVRTVEEVWSACMEGFAETAPGQEDIVQLLGQLYTMNLLETDVPADSKQLFSGYTASRKKELMAQFMNIMFIRLPLFDPEKLLNRFSWLIHRVLSLPGAIVWLVTVSLAVKFVIDNADIALDSAQAILAPDNLFLLYLSLVFVKAFHETGHAAVCHRYGGEVHTMGVSFMLFTPLPYMDATSSWGFRSRWHRAFVGAAGMVAELFIAAVAAIYWAFSGEGTLHALAYNIMFVASLSTILFNINPLLRLDGYYILSDLIDIPNLSARATAYIRYLLERFVLQCHEAHSSVTDRQEKIILGLFGILSMIYKVVIFLGIMMFIADRWLILGTIMAVTGVVTGVVVPAWRFFSYLLFNPALQQCRSRIILLSTSSLVIVLSLTALIPFPHHVDAPGVVESYPDIKVVTGVSGYVREYLAEPGQRVVAGQPLVRLENGELYHTVRGAEAKVAEIRVKERQSIGKRISDLKPVVKELRAVEETLAELQRGESELVVRARGNGVWMPLGIESMMGRWLERGGRVGDIVGGSRFRFAAVVPQDEAAEVFDGKVRSVEVRLWGEAYRSIRTDEVRLIPYQHEKLPSPVLGQQGGGNLAVNRDPVKGRDSAVEPFFLVNALLEVNSGVQLLHGRSGNIRINLAPEPLLVQWSRRLYQLFQKRYQM